MPFLSLTRRRYPWDATAMALALDTLAYARRLREAGFSEQQAEGQAEALAAAMTDTLATKEDLIVLRQELEVRFTQVDARFTRIDDRFASLEHRFEIRLDGLEKRIDSRMDARLADLERRMTMRLGGITVTGIGVVSALVRIL